MLGKLFGRQKASLPALRDTDADWQTLGRDEPFFGVLTDPRFLRANLTPAALDEFYASGVKAVRRYLSLMQKRTGTFAPGSALDFGCGVGRLTAALAGVTGDAIGVDISTGMLTEARKRVHPGLGFVNELPDRKFDWVVSIIVFQHIPPSRGYDLLRDLLTRVAPGGGITLQLTVFREPRHAETAGGRLAVGEHIDILDTQEALLRLPVGEMAMFDYDLSIVFALLVAARIGEITMMPTNHGGFHGVVILGRKPH